MDPRRRALIAAALAAGALAACMGDAGADAPDAAPRPDAPTACDPAGDGEPLVVGRCEREGGGDCTGATGEVRRFAALPAGGEVALVLGPQGARMFVFGLRTRGIVPGDPAQPASTANPLVEIHVADAAGGELARYRGRAAFAASGDELEVVGLFVVMDGAGAGLSGQPLHALATVRDAAGTLRCGTADFVAR